MAYIGKEPADSFISFAKQDFTTSATTSYTLDNAVTNENELALFINFVRQEPTTAYTASGTTLTLTSATTSSDDMYCVYLGQAKQTVNAPDGSVGSSQVAASIITGQTALTSAPSATDEFLISDAGTLKRIDASLVVGNTKQIVTTQTGAVATTSTIFPEDDTIPQNTEGGEFMTLAITPKSATSRLLITAQVFGGVSTGTRWGIGLFKDSDADALSFASTFVKDATSMSSCYLEHSLISGSTSAQTFKIRAGSIQTSATFTFNGQAGARKFGGVILSSIHITEIEV